MKKYVIAAAATAFVSLAALAPASAHINENVPANATRLEQGAPFAGFVGPIEATETNGGGPGTIESDNYVRAHSGMECGALRSPNITALGPVENGGIGFDDRFICPSADQRR